MNKEFLGQLAKVFEAFPEEAAKYEQEYDKTEARLQFARMLLRASCPLLRTMAQARNGLSPEEVEKARDMYIRVLDFISPVDGREGDRGYLRRESEP